MILDLAVFVQLRFVTDVRRTDRQTDIHTITAVLAELER